MPPEHKRTINSEDLYDLNYISGVRISPAGDHVVYSLQRVDRNTEKKYTNLWVVDIQAGKALQFTHGDHEDTKPRWSPDGAQIAFLSNRGDPDKPAQIYEIPFTGGEARPLTDIQGTIDDFSWSPGGGRLVCRVRKSDPEEIERENDTQKKELGVVSRHYTRVFYKLDGSGYLPQERWHIWTVDTQTGEAKQLTDHPIYDEGDPAWSPDGEWIAFVSNRSENPDFSVDAVDLFVIPSGGGEIQKLETPIGRISKPSYSPDGEWIAYYGIEGEGVEYKNQGLWIIPADGSSAPRNLTEKYDLHASSWTINDMVEAELMPPTWEKESQKIYFPVTYHGSSVLKSISIDGDDLQTVIDEGGAAGSISFDQSQERMAYFYASIFDPGQVFIQELSNKQSHQLTQHNRMLLDNIDLGEIECAWIRGADGNNLQGWILKPPGFNPNIKYPSILEIHGGPLTQYGYSFMHEFYYLAAQGYVVHFCNPRGGRGYGEEHAKAIWGDWGNKDYSDLMTWTDYVAGLHYIDAQRMGVTGGSYGGYMTVWIIGHTQRFKAAVTQRCVSNFISMWGSSDFNWSFQHELEAGPPFEDLQKFWDASPIKYIGSAKTPTLVIHSENDLRCPIEQGEQVFVALKRIGVDSEMVRFPDEFHGLSRGGRTDRRVVRLKHIARWLNKYLSNSA